MGPLRVSRIVRTESAAGPPDPELNTHPDAADWLISPSGARSTRPGAWPVERPFEAFVLLFF